MSKGNLSELAVGESGIIHALSGDSSVRCRLIDLGFTRGASVSCVMRSMPGGISAYETGGTSVALRKGDARLISLY